MADIASLLYPQQQGTLGAPTAAAPVVAQGAPQPAPAAAPVTLPQTGDSPEATQGFMDRLRSDPALAQSVLMTGLSLMSGPRGDENDYSYASRALMTGNAAKGFAESNMAEQERKDAESASLLESRDAQTAQTKQKTNQDEQLFPETRRKLTLDVQNAETEGAKRKAELLLKEFEADPVRMQTKFDLANKATNANINQSNAAASASSASAGKTAEDTKMRKWAVSGTEDEKKQARAYFIVDDPAAKSASAKTDNDLAMVRMANPGISDADAAKEVLSMNSAAKANYLAAAQKIVENVEGAFTAEQVATARQYMAGQVQAQAERNKPGAAGGGAVTPPAPDTAAWDKARTSVQIGQTYVGPDGKTYRRSK